MTDPSRRPRSTVDGVLRWFRIAFEILGDLVGPLVKLGREAAEANEQAVSRRRREAEEEAAAASAAGRPLLRGVKGPLIF